MLGSSVWGDVLHPKTMSEHTIAVHGKDCARWVAPGGDRTSFFAVVATAGQGTSYLWDVARYRAVRDETGTTKYHVLGWVINLDIGRLKQAEEARSRAAKARRKSMERRWRHSRCSAGGSL